MKADNAAPPEAPTPISDPAASAAGSIVQRLRARQLEGSVTFAAFLVLFAIYGIWLGGTFLSYEPRMLDIHQNAPVLLVALAAMITLVAGKFDLSVAAMATLTTYLTIGLVVKQGWPFGLVLVACLAAGLLGGLLNGLLVVGLRVNAFIATLGTAGIFGGLSAVYSGGTQLSPTSTGRQLPDWFSGPNSLGNFQDKVPSWIVWAALALIALAAFNTLRGHKPARLSPHTWLGSSVAIVVVAAAVLIGPLHLSHAVEAVSWTIAVLLMIALALSVLLKYTTFGRHLQATGSNEEASRLAGVNTARTTVLAFMLGGLLAATAGIILAAIQFSASPGAATGFLLPAFAAAFLSTVILSNGRFTAWGTIVGGIFVVWTGKGLVVGGLPFTWVEVVNGAVLVLAVAVGTLFRRQQA